MSEAKNGSPERPTPDGPGRPTPNGECIGIFGGSFDPPHVAHVMVAAYVLATSEIDRLLLVPAWQHPLDKEASVTFEERVRMCELAMRDLRRVEISRIEEELGGSSYTLRTIEALSERLPGARFRLVIGSDILAETDRWHRFEEVAALAPPLVIGRAGYGGDDSVRVDMPGVSSTDVRERLREGREVEGLVPRPVVAHIHSKGLYRTDGSA